MFNRKYKLPECVRVLPQPAQVIFRINFNKAYQIYADYDLAFEKGWLAVQKVYVKGKRHWIKRRCPKN